MQFLCAISFQRYHFRPTRPEIFLATIILRTGKFSRKLRPSNLAGGLFGWTLRNPVVHSQGPSEQKPIKTFRERRAWAYPGAAQIFGVPLLSQ